MSDQVNLEISYLQSKISIVSYKPTRFEIKDNNNTIVGIISKKGVEVPLDKVMRFQTLYKTLIDLDWKIKLSFEKAIKYAYSDSAWNNFSLIETGTKEEKFAYYYIENALFRTSSLWDMLAQLYNLYYDLNISINKVHYKKIFDPLEQYFSKFITNGTKIFDYIEQNDNSDCKGEWEGNHKFINKLRNKMTHKNSPNISAFSNFDFSFKNPPTYLLKRIIEDYSTVSKFINNFLDEIEEKVMNSSNNTTSL
ncbi:Cthe_2314 family HEPN domain-containing protein [uncultured Fusobacterium sp.]|uniref:Cthe_2314 family HEPN domain-containing protein n=1 Tax=uncultured Fusobacterium sp. TaxID=159267 RepID=UPI0025E34478|nr:Cthe_2314 family HEPN domain-containing protein [uncultured Fusobacterium sp.]